VSSETKVCLESLWDLWIISRIKVEELVTHKKVIMIMQMMTARSMPLTLREKKNEIMSFLYSLLQVRTTQMQLAQNEMIFILLR